jgi:hypothetical protein
MVVIPALVYKGSRHFPASEKLAIDKVFDLSGQMTLYNYL